MPNQRPLDLATQQLAEELHKPIFRKLKKRRPYSLFKDNIQGANLVGIQLISKYNKGIKFLLCVIDIFSKYDQVVPLKNKKDIAIVNAFQSILDSSKRKQNKTWVYQGSGLYSSSFKNWLKENHIEMYSTYNGGKSAVAERFIRTVKKQD